MNSPMDRRIWWSADFLGMLMVTALLLFEVARRTAGYSMPTSVALAFAVVGGLITAAILKGIGYFSCLRVVPRKSDVLLVVFAVVCAALASGELVNHLVLDRPLNLRWIMACSPLAAAMIFVAHYAHSFVQAQKNKRKVVLKLSEEEAKGFQEMLDASGLSKHLEILNIHAARRELRRSGNPEIDLVIISRDGAIEMQNDRFLIRAHLAGIPIVDRRLLVSHLTGKIRTEDTDLWSFVSSATRQTELLRIANFLKIVVEPVVAAALLVLLSPLLIGVAIAIRMESPGPVIYSQRRSGYLGRVFRLYKFRSMRTDSEAKGYQWASKEDSRVTRIGKFIRKVRIDELPQLWNVMKGDMGFVGPRPERPEIYRDLKPLIPMFSLRMNVRPGITGWAQVCAGYAATVEESKLKLEYDLYYIQNMSPRLDFIIVALTLKVMLFGSEYIANRGMPGMSIPSPTRKRLLSSLRASLRLKAAEAARTAKLTETG